MLSPKQATYIHNAHARWNIKTGAVRSGKTWLDTAYTIPARVRAAPMDGHIVLLGHTQETLRRNVITPMRRLWGEALVGPYSQADSSLPLFGRRAIVLGAAQRERAYALQGMGIAYAYGDEVTTWSKAVFEMVKSRLDLPESRFDGTCNPEGPQHWLKAFLDTAGDLYHQAYTIDDNPFLPPGFVAALKAEYRGSVLYDRYILGRWQRAEGLIYRSFDPARHVVQAVPPLRTVTFAADIGHANATVFLAIGEADDGRAYVLSEWRHAGGEDGDTRSPLSYARAFCSYQQSTLAAHPGAAYGGLYADPSALGFLQQLREEGVSRIYRAKNDVLLGIAAVSSRIDADALRVHTGCRFLLQELAGYAWDEEAARRGQDVPIKENDHAVDALRYWAVHHRLHRNGGNPYGTLEKLFF